MKKRFPTWAKVCKTRQSSRTPLCCCRPHNLASRKGINLSSLSADETGKDFHIGLYQWACLDNVHALYGWYIIQVSDPGYAIRANHSVCRCWGLMPPDEMINEWCLQAIFGIDHDVRPAHTSGFDRLVQPEDVFSGMTDPVIGFPPLPALPKLAHSGWEIYKKELLSWTRKHDDSFHT